VRVTGAVTVQAERPDAGFNLSDFAYALAADGALAYVPFIAPKRILSIVQPGGASRPIPGPSRAFAEGMAVSPDGQRIAVGIRTNPNAWGDIWVGDQLGNFLPLTRDGVSHYPVWNARGDTVAFQSRRSGDSQFIAQAIEGRAEPRVLFSGGGEVYPGTWLPDDLLVLNAANQSAIFEIRMLRPGEAQAERVPLSTTQNVLGRVSPDGRWLAYINGDSGKTEVYVTAFPEAGRVWPVSQGPSREPSCTLSGTPVN
jgi:Tol biopolymer transport system component